MKKYIFTILAAFLTVFAVSCQKTSADQTKVASYFQMLGASAMYLGVGDEFVDPGFVELEGGGKVTTTIYDASNEEVSSISTEEPTFYTIVYSTTNDQGFYFEKTRNVYVYDATITESLAGTFVVNGEESLFKDGHSFGEYAASYAEKGRTTTDAPEITFTQVAGNIYYCNDLLGGWYTWIQGRGGLGYGSTAFDMTGYVILNADMTVNHLSSLHNYWKDSLDDIQEGVYDPATKTLSYLWIYAGGEVAAFVKMKKK